MIGKKIQKEFRRFRIKKRVRKVVKGSAETPRLTVFRSNKQIYAQMIDDLTGKTIISASSASKEMAETKATKSEKAKMVGKTIAEKAIQAGIQKAVFDRNGYLYHGRIKILADSAREAGLKF